MALPESFNNFSFRLQFRKKIETDSAKPRYILTEPWIGYSFNAENLAHQSR